MEVVPRGGGGGGILTELSPEPKLAGEEALAAAPSLPSIFAPLDAADAAAWGPAPDGGGGGGDRWAAVVLVPDVTGAVEAEAEATPAPPPPERCPTAASARKSAAARRWTNI